MSAIRLEDVYKLSGIPTHTFVMPLEYTRLLVALRTAGRGVVVEGPSGIGKTSAIGHALEALGIKDKVELLSARKPGDRSRIEALPGLTDLGTVIVEDFHRLSASAQASLSDFLKTLADEERQDTKLVIVGINKVGESLVSTSFDLATRIDIIPFEVNPEDKISELIAKGEKALGVSIATKDEIAKAANGSFFVTQMLCHETCLAGNVLEAAHPSRTIEGSFEAIKSRAMDKLSMKFQKLAVRFATGKRLRPGGRAPYLHILKWLAEKNDWAINLDREIVSHPEHRGSVGQVVEKGYLNEVLSDSPELSQILHYDADRHLLSVEDPQFVFYLRNLSWNEFARQVGYPDLHFTSPFDFALSFAGADRDVAEKLFGMLSDEDFSVFYDKHEQHRILAENVEDYLGPIYRSEADYVVALLSPEYPKRIWTKFESDKFKARFKTGAVIPIWYTTVMPTYFDESGKVGGMTFDPGADVQQQLETIVTTLKKKIAEKRHQDAVATPN